MKRDLILVLLVLAAGLALGWIIFGGDGETSHVLAVQEDSVAAYREAWHTAEAEARRERARADSLAQVAREGVDTVRVAVERWDTITLPSPVDTAAIVAAFPGLVAAGDSLAATCERAARDCEAALDARDRELAAADSAAAVQAERVAALERYRAELADRLESVERWKSLRTLRDAAIGGATVYLVCSLVSC